MSGEWVFSPKAPMIQMSLATELAAADRDATPVREPICGVMPSCLAGPAVPSGPPPAIRTHESSASHSDALTYASDPFVDTEKLAWAAGRANQTPFADYDGFAMHFEPSGIEWLGHERLVRAEDEGSRAARTTRACRCERETWFPSSPSEPT
jgi:hypothetical protein